MNSGFSAGTWGPSTVGTVSDGLDFELLCASGSLFSLDWPLLSSYPMGNGPAISTQGLQLTIAAMSWFQIQNPREECIGPIWVKCQV